MAESAQTATLAQILNRQFKKNKDKLSFVCKCKKHKKPKLLQYKAFKNHNSQKEPTFEDLADKALQPNGLNDEDFQALYGFKKTEKTEKLSSKPVECISSRTKQKKDKMKIASHTKKQPKSIDFVVSPTKKRSSVDLTNSPIQNQNKKKKNFLILLVHTLHQLQKKN